MLGKYSTLGWYACKVVSVAEGGRWVVEWEDGDDDDTLKEPRHLKKRDQAAEHSGVKVGKSAMKKGMALKVVMSDAHREAAAAEARAECSLPGLHACIARRAELSRKGKEHELQQARPELSDKDKEYAKVLQLVRADAAARFAGRSADLREEHKECELLLPDKDELTSAHTIATQCVQLKALIKAEKEVHAVCIACCVSGYGCSLVCNVRVLLA